MDQGFKKISVFGLVLLIALPLVFTVVILVKQKIIQFQRNVRFDKEILQTVVVPTENIYWVKPGKEILLDGKLFDVKSFKVIVPLYVVFSVNDHRPTRYEESEDGIDEEGSPPPLQLLIWLAVNAELNILTSSIKPLNELSPYFPTNKPSPALYTGPRL